MDKKTYTTAIFSNISEMEPFIDAIRRHTHYPLKRIHMQNDGKAVIVFEGLIAKIAEEYIRGLLDACSVPQADIHVVEGDALA